MSQESFIFLNLPSYRLVQVLLSPFSIWGNRVRGESDLPSQEGAGLESEPRSLWPWNLHCVYFALPLSVNARALCSMLRLILKFHHWLSFPRLCLVPSTGLGIGKPGSMGHIQSAACFWLDHELKMTFQNLKWLENNKRIIFVTVEMISPVVFFFVSLSFMSEKASRASESLK